MSTGLSDEIRKLAKARYVDPAISAGKQDFAIRVRDISKEMSAEGLSATGHTPQICSALRAGKFLRENGLEIRKVEGPPSGQSPTVVFHYKVVDRSSGPVGSKSGGNSRRATQEDPDAWAERVTSKIRGLLKDEIAQFGGAEGFIRWVRSHGEEPE
jgi:hypothetical protein